MLTLRHVQESGSEGIKQASSVWLDTPGEDNDRHPLLWFYGENGQVPAGSYEDGVVYVMNENGKTVAIYDLHKMLQRILSSKKSNLTK